MTRYNNIRETMKSVPEMLPQSTLTMRRLRCFTIRPPAFNTQSRNRIRCPFRKSLSSLAAGSFGMRDGGKAPQGENSPRPDVV
jgi:hypothetical protein